MPRPTQPPAERFWAKVNKTDTCWLWTGYCNKGYGRFNPGGRSAPVKAYVWAWEQINGPRAPGMDLDHLCRVTQCVRPDHLEQVTHRENLLRAATGLAARSAAKTHCPQRHPYDAENTYVGPNGARLCRTCRKARMDRLNDQRRERNAALGRGKGRNKRTLDRA